MSHKPWDQYDSFDDAKEAIYNDYMPTAGANDQWAEALFTAGEYRAWAAYVEDNYDVEIDMGQFWEDFRDAYSAASG